MKISEIFNLEKSQRELDFIDIDTDNDLPLFVDPYFLSHRKDPWSVSTNRTIQSFFHHVIELLDSGFKKEARILFENLSEPNETCLGVSSDRPRGRGVGKDEAIKIFDSLMDSKAIESGLIGHFEDFVLFVDGVGKDKISDLTTNLIREHLIEYTQTQCKLHGIELTKDVPSGFYWNDTELKWDTRLTDMLIIDGRKIILVPKGAVSFSYYYIPDKYCQHFVLNFLQHEHIRLNSSLVRVRKQKKGPDIILPPYKKTLIEMEEPFRKEYLRDFTKKHPSVFSEFRQKAKDQMQPLTNEQLDGEIDINYFVDYLINRLTNINTGAGKQATKYHRHIVGIMEFLLYPNLTRPVVENDIHDGRKRLDISFDNAATKGFFHQLHDIKKIPSQYVVVECKNYASEVANPELDQLSGRFSPNRGMFGILTCRSIDNMELFLRRCNDTYRDGRGAIIPITDEDFNTLLNSLKDDGNNIIEEFLSERLRKVIMN
ncbi:hypothetical protein EI981_07535 [Paenibacillus lutimineralis]|uniref:Restriction endonuclease type IV Mrr domain-containing protein n=1 Tax=Paenibacillus lutimineralis TaxID=2707005 RepID=A0A3Q9IHJ8_9BACL|nr:hypothetical protein EI981_07535 [Paenibacillus lutimineralis]